MKTTDRNLIRIAGFVTGAIILALVTGIAVWVWNPGGDYYTDGVSLRQDAADVVLRQVLWEPPEQVGASFNADGDAYEPAVTADGRTMVFTRGRAARNSDLYVCRWKGGAWGEAEPLAEVNTENDELGPAISGDGQYLYFYSNRPGGQGGYDIWLARWDGYTWTHVTNVGDRVNGAFNEYGPALGAGGDRLYFSSNRPKRELTDEERDAWEATLREQVHTSDYDIYSSLVSIPVVTNETAAFAAVPEFGLSEALVELNSPKHDGQVTITPRGDFLYLSSSRDGGRGGFDLYRSRYLHGRYETPENLGLPVNTAAHEMDPSLHMEGFGLYFSSNRDQDDPRQYRLFVSVSRDVFLMRQESRLAVLLNMLDNVKWWILLFVAALVLIIYLLRNLLDARLRAQYSLLHRCIVGSVLAHVLLLFLLSLWFISSEFIQKMSDPAMDIALDVDALARERLSLEIREAVTELPESTDALIAEQTIDRLPIPKVVPTDDFAEPVITESSVDAFEIEPEAAPVSESPSEPQQPVEVGALPEMAFTPSTLLMEEREAPEPEATEALANLEAPTPMAEQPTSEAPAVKPIDAVAVSAPDTPVETTAVETFLETAETEAEVKPVVMETAVVTNRTVDLVAPTVVMETVQPSPVPSEREVRLNETPEPAEQHKRVVTSTGVQGPSVRELEFSAGTDVELDTTTLVRDHNAAEARTVPRIATASAELDEMPSLAFLPRMSLETVLPGVGEPTEKDLALSRPGRENDQQRSVAKAQAEARSTSVPVPATETMAADTALAAVPVPDLELPLPELNGFGQMASLQVPSLEMAPTIRFEMRDKLALPYFLRKSEDRGKVLSELGGGNETEAAVRRALNWFSANQEKDGHWDMDRHGGERGHEVASTGLALLCYFGWGADHMEDGPYKDNVSRGIEWMLKAMKKTGDLRSKDMYDQGIGTMALTEAFGLTQDEKLREPAQQAVDFIVRAQHKGTGGWRYKPGETGDTSVFGWQVMALKSARMAGLDVPDENLKLAERWFGRVGGGKHKGLYGYQDRNAKPAMTAEAMFCRQLLGKPPTEPMMLASAQYLHTRPPQAKRMDFYYFYYGTLALYQHQGPIWEDWNKKMKEILIGTQTTSGKTAGSWTPKGEHGNRMGRVVSTAMATLTLEVYYRYLPLYGLAREREAK